MRKTILLTLLLLGSAVASLAQTLPVTGTFINLPYQDVRNKYTNPELREADGKISTSMTFYFVMKEENGKVLLANQYKLDGPNREQRIYGWVDNTDCVHWKQRSCIESNWNTESVNKFVKNKMQAKVYAENTLETDVADRYFILKDFKSYAEAQKRVEAAYRDEKGWARSAILNTACSGKFTSDRTIQQYVDDIWKLDRVGSVDLED